MILVNASDVELYGTFSVDAPIYGDHSEMHIPPRSFTFLPREATELPDAAGEHFLKKFSAVGLVRYRLGEDMDEIIARGRRTWYATVNRQLAEHDNINGARLAQGLPPLPLGEHIVVVKKTRDMLAKEMMAPLAGLDLPVPTPDVDPTGMDNNEFRRAAAARREQIADAEALAQSAPQAT